MADEEQNAETAGGGGKKKILLLIIVALVLIGASVGGTMFALSMLEEEPPPEAEGEQDPDAVLDNNAQGESPAIYFPLKPALLTNFDARGRQRYLQAEVTLMLRDEAAVPQLELHAPAIRNTLVMLFAAQDYDELQTAEGKELLRLQSLEAVQNLLQQELQKPTVEQVFFTHFVMQ